MLILEIDDQGLGKDSQNLGIKSLENEDQNQEKGQNQEREGNIRIKYITMYRSGILFILNVHYKIVFAK